jgi:hypothetical protein
MILSNIFGMAGGYDGRCQRDLFSSVVRGGRQHFWSSWFTFKSQRSDHSIYFQQLQDSDITKVVELFTCLSLERTSTSEKILWPNHVILYYWRFVDGELFYQCLHKSHTTLWCPLRESQMSTWHIHTEYRIYIHLREELQKSRCSRHRGMNSTETNLHASLISWNPYTEATSPTVEGTLYLGLFRIVSRWRNSEDRCLLNLRTVFAPLFPRRKRDFIAAHVIEHRNLLHFPAFLRNL